MLKIWWSWKIEIWSEELVDGYQTVPYQPGALIWGGLLSGFQPFPTHLNPNNSLLIILQIPLLVELFKFANDNIGILVLYSYTHDQIGVLKCNKLVNTSDQ